MKKSILILASLLMAVCVSAQEVDKATITAKAEEAKKAADALKSVDTGDKAWKFSGTVGLNAAATGLVNWSAGGKNNVNGVAYTRMRLLWHKYNFAWDTNLDTEYGLTWIDQDEDPLQKSSDKINFSTKFGWEFHKSWYLTVLGGFQSQYAVGRSYATGYDNIISKWLAPSYTDISVGIDWKPNDIFSVYLSPIAGRITTAYVSDDVNEKYNEEYVKAFEATNPGEEVPVYDLHRSLQEKYGTYYYDGDEVKYRNFKAEFGLSFKGAINYKYKDLTIGTTLGLFTPYAWDKTPTDKGQENATETYFDFRDHNRRFGNFDVDWDVAISYQFLKVLNVTLSTSMKYYNGVLVANKDGVLAERVQFKSILGLGIGYSF